MHARAETLRFASRSRSPSRQRRRHRPEAAAPTARFHHHLVVGRDDQHRADHRPRGSRDSSGVRRVQARGRSSTSTTRARSRWPVPGRAVAALRRQGLGRRRGEVVEPDIDQAACDCRVPPQVLRRWRALRSWCCRAPICLPARWRLGHQTICWRVEPAGFPSPSSRWTCPPSMRCGLALRTVWSCRSRMVRDRVDLAGTELALSCREHPVAELTRTSSTISRMRSAPQRQEGRVAHDRGADEVLRRRQSPTSPVQGLQCWFGKGVECRPVGDEHAHRSAG